MLLLQLLPVHNESIKRLKLLSYFEAIGFSSLPERDREMTLQKLSMNKMREEMFHRSNLENIK